MAGQNVINIVLVGRTGTGKSATGNSILGHKMFDSRYQAGGFNMTCEMYRCATNDGPIINVIDTPGLFNLAVSTEILNKEIIRCLDMVKEGIHAVLFVLSVTNRISQEDELTFNALQHIFERNILDYFIVVFTAGDKLEEEGITFDKYLGINCPIFLTNVLKLCGGRKVVFDNTTRNKDKKDAQLKQLLAHVADVKRRTGGKPYTSKLHYKIQEENKELKVREKHRDIESRKLAEVEEAMKEKSQLEHERAMKMMQQMKENVSLREKERQIESKILAQAHEEATMMKENSQMEHEQTMKMMQNMEEKEKLRSKEREIEYIKFAKVEAKAAVMKEKSRIEHEKTMKMEEKQKLREKEREIKSKKLAKAEAKVAVMKEKLQIEHEKTMKMMQKMEENEKLREKEREIECEKLANAEVEATMMKEKARMEHEQTMKMVQKMEDNEKHRENERDIESKKIAEIEGATMKKKSQMEYEQNMKMMQQMMEHSLKQIVEANARERSQMREMFQQQQQQRGHYRKGRGYFSTFFKNI